MNLVAFLRQLEVGKQFNAGTFDSNITFIQALTEAMRAVPNAMLLASLPESALEVGGTMGQRRWTRWRNILRGWSRYGSLSPLKRPLRLCAAVCSSRQVMSLRCRGLHSSMLTSIASMRRTSRTKPNPATITTDCATHTRSTRRCLTASMRIGQRWTSFSAPVGVLQYMAIVIHRLWVADNRDALIMPGSLPLDDSNVRGKSIHYLPQGWGAGHRKRGGWFTL